MDGGLSKLLAASEQLAELNEKLAVQKIAVTEKTQSCEILLAEISKRTGIATQKKQLALGKKTEIAEQNVTIIKEKVHIINILAIAFTICPRFPKMFIKEKFLTIKRKPHGDRNISAVGNTTK